MAGLNLDFVNLSVPASSAIAIAALVSEATASAAAAEVSRDAIDNRIFPDSYTVAPTLRPDGTALQSGDAYWNSATSLTYHWNGAAWAASDIDAANLAASSGASLVGFLQSGTGALSRTMQSELRDRINVKQFGATGDGTTDDATNIGKAITFAALTSRIVYFPAATYVIASTISVPAGVALIGEGRGSIVNTTPTTGAILKYTGAGTAVSINGTLAGMERISVVGTSSAAVGVLLNGDGVNIESWYLRQITIYGFTGGAALKMHGINSGGVLYGSVYDLRIRHAKKGIYITDVGGGSGFVNTNQFYGGAINGGGFDYCIHADGGNDNRFYGMSVEPPSSVFGHIVLEANAELYFDGRVEASTQPAATPTIVCASTSVLRLAGFYAGTFIQNSSRRSKINVTSSKVAKSQGVPTNLLKNAAFSNVDAGALTIPEWTVSVTGGAPTLTFQAPELFTNANVLKVDVVAGSLVQITPSSTPHNGGAIAFGVWMKTAEVSKGLVTIQAPSVVSSSAHPGDSVWHQVGLALNTATGTPTSRIRLDNTAGGSVATFYVTAPFHSDRNDSFADVPALTANGGYLAGTIESNVCTITLPAAGDNSFYTTATSELTVPKWGNTVHITGTARTITRLNSLAANRWAQGTIVRLVFDISGVAVTNGAPGYIDLTAAFTSAAVTTSADRSWLLLESNGDGTWYELSRR